MSVSSPADLRPDSLTEVERHILHSLQQIRFGTLEVVYEVGALERPDADLGDIGAGA